MNVLAISKVGCTAGTAGTCPLSPVDAWNIDTKSDDGMPGTGRIITNKGDGTNTFCTNSGGVSPPGDAGSVYQLSNNNKDCAPWWVRAF